MAKRKTGRSRRQQRRARSGRPRWFWPGVIGTILIVVFLAGIFLLNRRPVAPADPPAQTTATPAAVPEPAAATWPAGNANYCRRVPAFTEQLQLGTPTYVGTSLKGFMGLTLSDSTGRVYQDDSWDDAGFLGPFVYDEQGNIYTAPAPFINLTNNPPAEQNRIYRVDTNTGKMAQWIDLPAAQPPTQANPFGVIGLFYDCDVESIYAGSVAGSTAAEEVGRIFRVARDETGAPGEVAAVYEGVDALGVAVYNGVNGKRLYFGSGRDSGVRSIALDEAGDFVGEPRVEFYLAQFEEGGNEKAQRITFNADNQMIVKGLEFDFNLRAASEAVRVLYTMAYEPERDGWSLISVERTTE